MNITKKLILVGVGIGALFWIIEALLEVFVFYHGRSFFYYIFPPEPHIIWHRLIVITLLIVFGLLARFTIIESKKAEEALKDSEKKYRNIVDNALVGIYKSNLKGELLYANKTMAKMFEFDSPEEMMQAGVLPRYKNPKDREVIIERLKKIGKINNFEIETITKTGKPKNILVSAVLEGDTLSGMIMDVSERFELERSLKKRVKELEMFYDMAIGREVKMTELKEEIERLKKQPEGEKT
jgi:PAS domain S-box-containing protein